MKIIDIANNTKIVVCSHGHRHSFVTSGLAVECNQCNDIGLVADLLHRYWSSRDSHMIHAED